MVTDVQCSLLSSCSYAEFVVVSKDISTLENEMLEFKDALSEWKGMPSLLHIDDSASAAGKSSHVCPVILTLRQVFAILQNAEGTSGLL